MKIKLGWFIQQRFTLDYGGVAAERNTKVSSGDNEKINLQTNQSLSTLFTLADSRCACVDAGDSY